MNDKQLKFMAEMIRVNDERLSLVERILRNDIISAPFDGRANALLSDIEKLSALAQVSSKPRAELRKFLGLE